MLAKRLSLSLLAVAATSLVVTAASFALFSATTTNNNNTFSAGTVALGGVAGCGNTVNNIAPGDSGSFTCTVTYTGSLKAYIGYSATMSGDLTTCDGGGRFTASNVPATNQVLGIANPEVSPATGMTQSVTVNWALALAAGNDCQGDSADIGITFKAVQFAHNDADANGIPDNWN